VKGRGYTSPPQPDPPPLPFFVQQGGRGPAHENFRKREGGLFRIRRRGGYPHPFMRSPHPPSSLPEGWGPLPLSPVTPHETYLLKVEARGGSPPFFAGQGGWGFRHEKAKRGGRGVPYILDGWGYPPPGFFRNGPAHEPFFIIPDRPDRSVFQELISAGSKKQCKPPVHR